MATTRLIGPRLRSTLAVAIPGLLLAWLAGLGSALCTRRINRLGSWLDLAASALALVPEVIAVALLLWLAVWLGAPAGAAWLPILGLAFAMTPVIFMHASSGLCEATEMAFVKLARQRGVVGPRLWLCYVLPAAASPLISLAGLSLSTAIGTSLWFRARFS